MVLGGCYSVPHGKSAVTKLEITGAPDLDLDDLETHIATRKSVRGLGIAFGFIYDYEIFDRYTLRRDLSRVERYMQAHGYYDAKVRVARVVPEDEKGQRVRVVIEVEEGAPVKVESVTIAGDGVDDKMKKSLSRVIDDTVDPGDRLDEAGLLAAETAATKQLTRRGYASASVTRRAEVDLAAHTARVSFDVKLGPVSHFGPVTFEGLGELPEDKIRHVFAIQEGQEYSSAEIDDATKALLDLGVFASVDVVPDLSQNEQTHIVPIAVKTKLSKLRSVRVGGGLELDTLKSDLHGQLTWTNGNFLGGLRHFEASFKPGVVLYPTHLAAELTPPEKLLYEQKISLALNQPGFVEARTTGSARVEYNVYPVILPVESSNVVGYHELKTTEGIDRTFWKVDVNPAYTFQASFPIDYLGHTPDVHQLYLSYVDLGTTLDLRNDPFKPTRGAYFANHLQFAGGPLLGDATDVRVEPEARGYYQIFKRIVLAARVKVGFLFPLNYGDAASLNYKESAKTSTGDVPSESFAEKVDRDFQILFFRGFFGGGPTSNRGYPLRAIGPHDLIPYVSPAGQSGGAACSPENPSCVLPTGGLSEWELAFEARISIAGPFAMALFCDAGDVSPFLVDIRPDRPHLSCGPGFRYATPVGAIRLDVGYRIPGVQTLSLASGEEPPDTIFGLPIAVAFGIGEAF